MDCLLRLRDVALRTGMSRSTIYRRIEDKTFPKPVKVGGFAVRWRESTIDGWIAGLSSERSKKVDGGTVGGIAPLVDSET